jgi:Protein of unknown function (DUF3293)
MSDTVVLDDKISAYTKTNYTVLSEMGDFTFNVGKYSPILNELHASKKTQSSAFITAFNPHGTACDVASNLEANKRLLQSLKKLGYHLIEGAGVDPEGLWPPEPSFLVIGIDQQTAELIGKEFHQDAIIWIGRDAMPRLVLLR